MSVNFNHFDGSLNVILTFDHLNSTTHLNYKHSIMYPGGKIPTDVLYDRNLLKTIPAKIIEKADNYFNFHDINHNPYVNKIRIIINENLRLFDKKITSEFFANDNRPVKQTKFNLVYQPYDINKLLYAPERQKWSHLIDILFDSDGEARFFLYEMFIKEQSYFYKLTHIDSPDAYITGFELLPMALMVGDTYDNRLKLSDPIIDNVFKLVLNRIKLTIERTFTPYSTDGFVQCQFGPTIMGNANVPQPAMLHSYIPRAFYAEAMETYKNNIATKIPDHSLISPSDYFVPIIDTLGKGMQIDTETEIKHSLYLTRHLLKNFYLTDTSFFQKYIYPCMLLIDYETLIKTYYFYQIIIQLYPNITLAELEDGYRNKYSKITNIYGNLYAQKLIATFYFGFLSTKFIFSAGTFPMFTPLTRDYYEKFKKLFEFDIDIPDYKETGQNDFEQFISNNLGDIDLKTLNESKLSDL